jgi:hypothetical protein
MQITLGARKSGDPKNETTETDEERGRETFSDANPSSCLLETSLNLSAAGWATRTYVVVSSRLAGETRYNPAEATGQQAKSNAWALMFCVGVKQMVLVSRRFAL